MKRMSEEFAALNIKEQKDESAGWSSEFWFALIMSGAFGFGNWENPRINELEKKVARLEGQMSMIGGRKYE